MKKFVSLMLLALAVVLAVAIPVGAQLVPSRDPTTGQGCDCPYDIDAAGRRCGGRSAYSRPGGASPVCYTQRQTAQTLAEPAECEHYSRPRSNLRTGPSTTSGVITQLSGEEFLEIHSTQQRNGTSWSWVTAEIGGDGQAGWLRSDLILCEDRI